jgi:predicted CoA-binding protein
MSIEKDILDTCKVVAIVGLSADPDRPSNHVGSYLKEKGYKIIPVNPNEKEILGEVCYPDLESVPEVIEVVDIFRRPESALSVIEDAIRIGAKAVWMQEGVINKEAADKAEKAGLKVVMDRCMRKEHMRFYGFFD